MSIKWWSKLWAWIKQDMTPPDRAKTYDPKTVLTNTQEFEKGLDHIEDDLNDLFDNFIGSHSK